MNNTSGDNGKNAECEKVVYLVMPDNIATIMNSFYQLFMNPSPPLSPSLSHLSFSLLLLSLPSLDIAIIAKGKTKSPSLINDNVPCH